MRLGSTLLALGAWCLISWPQDAVSDERVRFAGRTLHSVLSELSDSGLRLIYSTELVPDTLIVRREPRSHDRLRLVRELLADVDLVARAMPGGAYVVARAEQTASEQHLNGRVLDAESGAAVPTARVELHPMQIVRVTDANGRFSFTNVPAARYLLRVTAADYGQAEQTATVSQARAADEVTSHLARAALTEIVVATSRYSFGDIAHEPAFRLNRSQLTAQPSLGDDPLRSASRLPGLAQDGISALANIRGGEADEVLVLLDGFMLRGAYHLPGYQSLFSVLDENLIDSMDIYTGGFGARHGNRLAGVFDLKTVSVASEPRHSLGVSFVNAHARTAGTVPGINADYLLAGRMGTLDGVLDALSPETGRPSYQDAYARVAYRLPSGTELRANGLWASDELVIDDEDERAEYESRARYLWLRAHRELHEHLNTTLWFGHSRLESRRNGTVEKEEFLSGTADDSRRAGVTDLRAELEWSMSPRHQMTLGVDNSWARGRYDYLSNARFGEEVAALFDRPVDLERDVDLRLRTRRYAFFVSDRWRLNDRWVTELGVRAQRVRATDGYRESTLDPRFGLRVALRPRTRLRVNWGQFHQADEAQDLRVEDGVTALQRARRSEHVVVGVEHELHNGLRLRGEAFQKREQRPRPRFENALNRLELLPELTPDRISLVPDSAEISGLEASLALERGTWNAWLTVTRSKALDEFGGRDFPRSWDQRWAAQAGGEWRRGPWTVSGAFAWHTGWPTTPIISDTTGVTLLGERNSARLPSYASLDLRAEYRRPLARGGLVVALEVTNAANRRNVCCTEIESEEDANGDFFLVSEPKQSLPLLPSVAVKWEF